MKNENDVTEELWENRYMVYLPFYSTGDREDLRVRGIAGHHDKESLEAFLNQMTLVYATPVHLAERAYQGDTIEFVHKEDATEIYNLVIQHLENWIFIGNKRGGRCMPPLSDLEIWDDFAAHLFNHVIFTPKVKKKLLPSYADGFLGGQKDDIEIPSQYNSYMSTFIEMGAPMI